MSSAAGNVIQIGPHKLEQVIKTKTIKCPLCRKQVAPEDHVESKIAVHRPGKRLRFVRSILAECCAREYILEVQ